MALIPVRDKRLRPRRTWLWVAVAVLLCSITAVLLIFFLLPRSVVLSSNAPLLHPWVSEDPDERFSLLMGLSVSASLPSPLSLPSAGE